ncbi:Pachytene checkpoint protein 2 [Nymphon striatum]|nr:Pachytene checkpoint protein 2 [Nymphon striatum]
MEQSQSDCVGDSNKSKEIIHAEILLHDKSMISEEAVVCEVARYLTKFQSLHEDKYITEFIEPELRKNVKSILVSGVDELLSSNFKAILLDETMVRYHIYRLDEDGPAAEDLDGDNDANEQLAAANHWLLPSKDFHGLWENLIYDSGIKYDLLNFVTTTLLFSDRDVDHNVISWNRVVLLHGPPGTGKTSLCKALAQKLSIRLGHRYKYGQLIEINSHSLFSKWFSESGKLVMKMFQKIKEMIDDPSALVCVLIDEIESLSHARKSSLSGNEPSDSMRVVNALLTQIDQLKRYSNVLILTTSNMTSSIDEAFIDRADIKQYIGLPTAPAIYQIYKSCLKELSRANIISDKINLLDHHSMNLASKSMPDDTLCSNSLRLWKVANESVGLSGRTLRKIPFLAHALYIQSSTTSFENFTVAISQAVKRQFSDQQEIAQC